FRRVEGSGAARRPGVARPHHPAPRTPKTPGPGRGPSSASTLESPACPGGPPLPGAWLEDFVAGALWDLTDDPNRDLSSNTEPADRLCDKDDVIFSIFDRELQRVPANIQSFTDAWVARGL